MHDYATSSTAVTIVGGAAIVLIVVFFRHAWRVRRYMRTLQKQGLVRNRTHR